MLKIYTDGSCPYNPGKGGWAFVIPKMNIRRGGHSKKTTNNIMELTAIIRAMEWCIENGYSARIYSDSQYCVKGINQWMQKWAKAGWKKPRKNREMWQHIYELDKQFQGSVKWIKGHDGNKYNEQADLLAGLYATNPDME